MIINSSDHQNGVLDFRLKVTRQTLGRFIGVLPLLIPEARRSFPRVSFWLDIPVDIGYYAARDTMDLSSKRIYFKVTDDEMLCYIPGYDKAITTSVMKFVEMVNELHTTIEGCAINPVKSQLTNSLADSTHDAFRTVGVQVKNSWGSHVMAAYNADVCIISNYMLNNNKKTLERFPHAKSMNYFRYTEEYGWDMSIGIPFMSHELIRASSIFRA